MTTYHPHKHRVIKPTKPTAPVFLNEEAAAREREGWEICQAVRELELREKRQRMEERAAIKQQVAAGPKAPSPEEEAREFWRMNSPKIPPTDFSTRRARRLFFGAMKAQGIVPVWANERDDCGRAATLILVVMPELAFMSGENQWRPLTDEAIALAVRLYFSLAEFSSLHDGRLTPEKLERTYRSCAGLASRLPWIRESRAWPGWAQIEVDLFIPQEMIRAVKQGDY